MRNRQRLRVFLLVTGLCCVVGASLGMFAATPKITYFAHIVATQANALKPILERAQEELGFEVELQYTDFGTYYDKLTTMIIGGQAPEIVEVGTDLVPWGSRGL